jgi:class 3 adenylate cyclase
VTLSEHGEPTLRVSDADRDRVVNALREHVAAGRLSMDEFNTRIAEALAARTDGELRHALRELPDLAAPQAATMDLAPRRRKMHWALWRFATINGTCVGIWAATGAHEFWPAFVLIPTGAITLRRLFGPSHADVVRAAHTHAHHGRSAPRQRTVGEERTQRTVMTVLYVDIVDSTRRAVTAGDAVWRRLADQYERQADAVVHSCGGRTLFNKGDEMVATFTLPASAVRCAEQIRDQALQLGLQVRAGIHAGEVDRIGSRVEGIAMHIGRRVCESAVPDQILVSSTVRDLLVGSGRSFIPTGEHELKGLDGTWLLYEAASG